MRAVVWEAPRRIAVNDVPDPRLEEPTDAVIRVTATAICGSDLHLLEHGASMLMKPGDILGHEAMGVVEEVGSEVSHIKPGDTVVVPFNISCGECYLCRRGLYSQCETTQNWAGRRGGSLFGYTHLYGGVPGGQAEYLRVPQAHFGPIPVDGAFSELAAVLLSDVLPTSWQAVEYADVPPDGSVVVLGLGPIGQTCVRIARHRGAGQIIGVDFEPDRRASALAHGATDVVDPGAVDAVAAVQELTSGRGADSVIEAVGMDSAGSVIDRVLQLAKVTPDRLHALRDAMSCVRRGGTLSVVGVYGGWYPLFPLGDLFDRQITVRWGQANVRRWTDTLVSLLEHGDPLGAAELVTHEVPLEQAPEWYRAFRDKQPGVRKVVLRP